MQDAGLQLATYRYYDKKTFGLDFVGMCEDIKVPTSLSRSHTHTHTHTFTLSRTHTFPPSLTYTPLVSLSLTHSLYLE